MRCPEEVNKEHVLSLSYYIQSYYDRLTYTQNVNASSIRSQHADFSNKNIVNTIIATHVF